MIEYNKGTILQEPRERTYLEILENLKHHNWVILKIGETVASVYAGNSFVGMLQLLRLNSFRDAYLIPGMYREVDCLDNCSGSFTSRG